MPVEKIEKLRDVFGVARDIPLTYQAREQVDGALVANLTRDKHVVIYGSSKQGKTTLRKHCLDDNDYVVISCINTMSISDLNGAILKKCGYQVEQTNTKTVGGHWRYGLEFKGEGGVPFITKASGGGNASYESRKEEKIETRRLEIDLEDVNDIITALKEIAFSKFIVLEDFHYLPIDTQKNFSFSLKSFHENSKLCFIIVGVWREKNRLIYYNGDLTQRVVSVDVDAWSLKDLHSVMSAGEAILNISFHQDINSILPEECFESVSLFQEACYRVCEGAGVVETQQNHIVVGEGVDVKKLIREIVDEQAGRYSAFITNFSEGFQPTGLEMYKWLVYAVVASDTDELERGLRRAQVAALIKAKHPQGQNLNEGNITQALLNAAALQVSKSIRPIIFDYDQTTKVFQVVDRSFLIWLSQQDRSELMSELDL